MAAEATATSTAYFSDLVARPGKEYEALCNELGRDRKACFGVKVLIFLATTFAPAGSLTTRDAIAITSLFLTMTTLVVRRFVPALLIHLQIFWSIRVGEERGVERRVSRKWQDWTGGGRTASVADTAVGTRYSNF